MPKKHSVIRDDLKINNKYGGLYCFMPFENFDDEDKAVMKIGMTSRPLTKRTDNYHTYFPMGVTLVASLESPLGILNKEDKEKADKRREHYEAIENFLFAYIIAKGGYRIISTAKLKDEGLTEWVYTSVKMIHDAFTEAQILFKGRINLYNLNDPDYLKFENDKLKKDNYIGEIIYPLVNPKWHKDDKKKKKKK